MLRLRSLHELQLLLQSCSVHACQMPPFPAQTRHQTRIVVLGDLSKSCSEEIVGR